MSKYEPFDMMEGYPFTIIDEFGNKEYITDEYIHYNFTEEKMAEFLNSLNDKEILKFKEIQNTWPFLARKKQRLPLEYNNGVMFLGGRGSGKTRASAENFIQWCMSGKYQRCNMIGPTERDVEMTMILGPSGIKSICDERGIEIKWNKGDHMITWPNGTVTLYFSADEPERLRGVNSSKIWMDEVVAWSKDIQYIFDNMMFGLRLDDDPSWLISTTPKNEDNPAAQTFLRNRYKQNGVITLEFSTYENYKLPKKILDYYRETYEGTAIGDQELHAKLKLTDDDTGPVFDLRIVNKYRVEDIPEDIKIIKKIVSVDPSVSDTSKSDECGIIVLYLGSNGKIYIVDDLSGRYKAEKWAEIARNAYYVHQCDYILAETNQGGDLVESIIKREDKEIRFKEVKAKLGKKERAIPVSYMYQKGLIRHVGKFETLEQQMVDFNPDSKKKNSPDRVDAMVHGAAELEKDLLHSVSQKIKEFKRLGFGQIMTNVKRSAKYKGKDENYSFFKEYAKNIKRNTGVDVSKMSIFKR